MNQEMSNEKALLMTSRLLWGMLQFACIVYGGVLFLKFKGHIDLSNISPQHHLAIAFALPL